jgi:hypothetical protein
MAEGTVGCEENLIMELLRSREQIERAIRAAHKVGPCYAHLKLMFTSVTRSYNNYGPLRQELSAMYVGDVLRWTNSYSNLRYTVYKTAKDLGVRVKVHKPRGSELLHITRLA